MLDEVQNSTEMVRGMPVAYALAFSARIPGESTTLVEHEQASEYHGASAGLKKRTCLNSSDVVVACRPANTPHSTEQNTRASRYVGS